MNKKTTIFALALGLLCIACQVYSQAPQLLNYQAVARNGSNIIANQAISLQFTIHDQTTNGTILYEESFVGNIQTNSYGIFTAKIGNGTVEAGTFSSIDWSSGSKYLEVDIDETGGSNWTTMGTAQLISVPYALYANKADTANVALNVTTVTLSAGQGINITGAYPNFTVIATDTTPAGTIVAFGGTNIPAGWLLCDGSSYSTTGTYSNLYAAISFNYGGSGVSFNVPDLRGRFLRGVDGTAGNDPDRASRTISNPGGQTGNNVGSLEADTLKSHSHVTYVAYNLYASLGQGALGGSFNVPYYSGGSTQSTGGSETRPKNVYVNYIIKY